MPCREAFSEGRPTLPKCARPLVASGFPRATSRNPLDSDSVPVDLCLHLALDAGLLDVVKLFGCLDEN